MALRDIVAANNPKVRISEGLTQTALAQKAGPTDVYISKVERNSQNITLDSLESIASALGVPVVSLLDGSKVFAVKMKNAKVSAASFRHAADALKSLADSLEGRFD
jgi:transcriptional regulator with XRE-family HTH domain